MAIDFGSGRGTTGYVLFEDKPQRDLLVVFFEFKFFIASRF